MQAMNQSERQQMERRLKQKIHVHEIAALLDRHCPTIYREIKRGLTPRLKSDLSVQTLYQAERPGSIMMTIEDETVCA